MYIFTIYDCVSEKAGNIFTTETLGEAERQFNDALTKSEVGSLFNSHPQDFSLHLLGEFDPKEFKITNTKSKKVATGKPHEDSPA